MSAADAASRARVGAAAALASLGFAALALTELFTGDTLRGPVAANVATTVLTTAPLLFGAARPVLTGVIALAALLAQTVWLTPSTHLAMPLAAALAVAYVAGRHAAGRAAALGLLTGAVAGEWLGPIAVNRDPVDDAIFVTALLVVAWLAGRARRARALLHAAERERDAVAAAAGAAERERIARDLHDVVAHAVTVMVVQATGTRLVARERPELAVRALAEIESTGREALDELRRMLGVLRGPATDAAGGLPELDRLVQRARAAGARVELTVEPAARAAPRAIAAAAYRIVQEAVTNALRHAPGAPVSVTVGGGGPRLTVRVHNGPPAPGATAPVTGAGRGLAGLRERVAVHQGQLSSGPADDGGFLVEAVLPCAEYR
ncbi:sensor histidine kinase [Actinoplanes teichomyceticus]|uniref:histidine kinase n=1 Tax=Actinoplanes teichomyceticus TaxID=1867 RepID=A0A561VCQ9_ACTTI|nr:histidine kinase [Actinoplanes teichomyceticus]TWG09394.1 histidine kinase [Actinoplanes teichomyceticus]GIF17023.1 hypothetical protein Ate01nite_70550 [Actinoplanes teichomyceticus]